MSAWRMVIPRPMIRAMTDTELESYIKRAEYFLEPGGEWETKRRKSCMEIYKDDPTYDIEHERYGWRGMDDFIQAAEANIIVLNMERDNRKAGVNTPLPNIQATGFRLISQGAPSPGEEAYTQEQIDKYLGRKK